MEESVEMVHHVFPHYFDLECCRMSDFDKFDKILKSVRGLIEHLSSHSNGVE